MTSVDPYGSDWTEDEVELVVAGYFDMLALELAGRHFIKAEHNRALQATTGRSRGSIEFKLQNISAVLWKLGIPWIAGYAPMANYQQSLLGGIEQFLSKQHNFPSVFEPTSTVEFSETQGLFIEPPPMMEVQQESIQTEPLKRLIQKFDPAARDERNRTLGKRGEELVLHHERLRLGQDRPDLAKKVKWISQELGDGAGYDILSFDITGKERLIEVKTTIGHRASGIGHRASKNTILSQRQRV